ANGLIEPGDALSGRRVFDITQPVPHHPADVKLVVKNAGTAGRVAVDRGGIPFAAAGARNLVSVQAKCDPPGRLAGREFSEDAVHDCGLVLVDIATAAARLPPA